jgi:hypothetical protein
MPDDPVNNLSDRDVLGVGFGFDLLNERLFDMQGPPLYSRSWSSWVCPPKRAGCPSPGASRTGASAYARRLPAGLAG